MKPLIVLIGLLAVGCASTPTTPTMNSVAGTYEATDGNSVVTWVVMRRGEIKGYENGMLKGIFKWSMKGEQFVIHGPNNINGYHRIEPNGDLTMVEMERFGKRELLPRSEQQTIKKIKLETKETPSKGVAEQNKPTKSVKGYVNPAVPFPKAPRIRMALFVEQEHGKGIPVVEMKVYRAYPRMFYVAAKPVLEVGKGTLKGAYLIEGKDKTLSLQLHFTSRGKALFEDITTRFRKQRLFIVVAMPDKKDEKKIVSRCIGVVYVQNTITGGVLQFTPDADEEEAIEIVNALIKAK